MVARAIAAKPARDLAAEGAYLPRTQGAHPARVGRAPRRLV